MQQIVQYRDGERDYTLIKGDTGPLVYPAGTGTNYWIPSRLELIT